MRREGGVSCKSGPDDVRERDRGRGLVRVASAFFLKTCSADRHLRNRACAQPRAARLGTGVRGRERMRKFPQPAPPLRGRKTQKAKSPRPLKPPGTAPALPVTEGGWNMFSLGFWDYSLGSNRSLYVMARWRVLAHRTQPLAFSPFWRL